MKVRRMPSSCSFAQAVAPLIVAMARIESGSGRWYGAPLTGRLHTGWGCFAVIGVLL